MLVAMIKAIASREPVLILIEDLHWIDPSTLELLNLLIEHLRSARVVLVVTYRPEYRHDWGGKTYYAQVPVDPLPPAGADALLRRDPGGV